jgi:hypothetical protein
MKLNLSLWVGSAKDCQQIDKVRLVLLVEEEKKL